MINKFGSLANFKPALFTILRSGKYSKETFISDFIAGVIVAVIALPLAIAFGIASGVTPQQGLITAIVAGILTSLFGGSKFLIGGPTGAFIVIIFGIVSQYGITGLITATLIAGVLLLLMGLFKMGSIIKFIPYPIVVGFTSGIALVIFTTQLKDFFGFAIESVPADFIPKWGAYFQYFSTLQISEFLLALSSLLIIIFWPKVTKIVPGSLIAILVGTFGALFISYFTSVEFITIGSRFPELGSGVPLPTLALPKIDFATIRTMFQPALTIALLCAIESLLAAMVADGVTGKRHDPNTELIGQGITNIITPLFGGIPSTGALARTMANINNGGKSPLAGIVHGVILLLIYLFLMPYVIYIPLATLSAILIIVAYNMSEWRTFTQMLKAEKTDVIVLLTTFFLTVLIDLTVAIEVGVILAVILFVKRISETSSIKVIEQRSIEGSEEEELPYEVDMIEIPNGVEVYEIDGPFFFGLASKLDEIDTSTHKVVKVRIIRMRKVPFIDTTGINNLKNLFLRSKREKIEMILSGVNDDVYQSLLNSGLIYEIGRENIFPHILMAIERSKEIIGRVEKRSGFVNQPV
ncbi:MAG: SulP family inorganic anion transporter [Bacteroidales bacterium]